MFFKGRRMLCTSSSLQPSLPLQVQSIVVSGSECFHGLNWDSVSSAASGPSSHLCFFGVGWSQKNERATFFFFYYSCLYPALLLSTFLFKHKWSISIYGVIWFHIFPMLEDKVNLFIFLFWNKKIYTNICFVGQTLLFLYLSDCKHLNLFYEILMWYWVLTFHYIQSRFCGILLFSILWKLLNFVISLS